MKTQSTQLAAYFDAYIERRDDLAFQTVQILKQVRNWAVGYFGGSMMKSVTTGDAKDYRRHASKKLAPATVAMHIKKLRQLWADAIDHELLTVNPWKAVKPGTQVNASRQVYVPAETILKVIEACPSLEWKLLFALARFAGMRVPSEPNALKWGDINFAAGRIVVHSSKTKHHPGKESRVTPLFRDQFPELERLLLLTMASASDGTEFVMERFRLHRNLATTAKKIVTRAGFAPWPRFWNNLRSSCETDLAVLYPIHVVCSWIGNSAGVAKAHYLQITDEDFALANTGSRKVRKSAVKTVGKSPDSYDVAPFPTGSAQNVNPLRITQAAADVIQSVLRREKRRLAVFDRRALRNLSTRIAAARARGSK
jgi:hypothetical protein